MTETRRAFSRVGTATFAGLTSAGVLLAAATPAWADPDPALIPSDPAAAAPPPAPGPPMVPEIANPVYGSGQYGGGALGTLRDLWHQARDPYAMVTPAGPDPEAPGPPPGAGPAPQLPPGFVSLTAPGSEAPSIAAPGSGGPTAGPATGGPALPPGYYPLTGPPPPGYEYKSMDEPEPAPPPLPVTIMAPSYRN